MTISNNTGTCFMEKMKLNTVMQAVETVYENGKSSKWPKEELKLTKYLVLAWLPSITTLRISNDGSVGVEFNGSTLWQTEHLWVDEGLLHSFLTAVVNECAAILENKKA